MTYWNLTPPLSTFRWACKPLRDRDDVDARGSAAGHLLQLLGVPGPLHRDLRGGGLDLAEVVGRELDRGGPEVLVQPMELRGARDGDDPGLLGEQPGERDLGGRRLLPLGDAAEQVDQGLIRLQGLGREARQGAAEVGAVEASCSRRSCP